MLRRLSLCVLGSCGLWMLIIGLVIAPGRALAIPAYEPLPQQYSPFVPENRIYDCCCGEEIYQSYPILRCRLKLSDPIATVWFTYDHFGGGSVGSVSADILPQRFGDLVLAWGYPIDSANTSYGHYIFWRDRNVYVAGSNFTPWTKIYKISYGPSRSFIWYGWRGFRQK